MGKSVRMEFPEQPEKFVEIPDNGSNKKIEEGERAVEDNIKQAKRIISLKNLSSDVPKGRGGTITDESMEEMMDLTYGDLKPSGVSDSMALGEDTMTPQRAQQIYNRFVQRFTVLLTSNFGTRLERVMQQAFPEGTNFMGYLQRSALVLSVLYKYPGAEPNEIVNAMRRHRVVYRTTMMWYRRLLKVLDDDLQANILKKATSADKGPHIPKYSEQTKHDFNKTMRELKTPTAANSFYNEVLIKDNLQECIDAMQDAQHKGDKDEISFWKTEIRKLDEAMESLKREEKHMKHAAHLFTEKKSHRVVKSKLNKSILKKGTGDEQLDPRVYVGTMIEGPLNIGIMFDGTTDTYTESGTGAIISNRRLVENPWLELTADGFRKIHQMAVNYNKKMPPLIRKTSETTKTQPTEYYEDKMQPSMKNVIDKRFDRDPAIHGAQPVGGDPNKLVKIESADKSNMRQSLKRAKENLRHTQEMLKDATTQKNKSKDPGKYVERVSTLTKRVAEQQTKISKLQTKISSASVEATVRLSIGDKFKYTGKAQPLDNAGNQMGPEKHYTKETFKLVDIIDDEHPGYCYCVEDVHGKEFNIYFDELEKAKIEKASVIITETAGEEVVADIVPSTDPHVLAHDDLEVHLNGAGFTLERVHPEKDCFRTYVAWYRRVPLNGVGNTLEETKSIIGGALFAACRGTDFAPVGEGWTDETNDDGEGTNVFKMLNKKSKTCCDVDISTNVVNFCAVA